jgi:gas vesicle protein
MKAFFTGLGLGAAVGLLLAPKSGSETRNDIQKLARNSYEGGRDRLQDILEQISRRTQSVAEPIADQFRDIRDQVRDRVGASDMMTILNEWPRERLTEIDGIGPVLADKIIQQRPYESEQELIDLKQLPPGAIESLRDAA